MAKLKRLPIDSVELQGRAATFFDVMKSESDRGYVLVGATFLDEALEILLRSEMSQSPAVVKNTIDPMFTGMGPLRSFGAKTELCLALKLIYDEEYVDITSIRGLRNHFAHSYVDATFKDRKAVRTVTNLRHFGIAAFPITDAEKDQSDPIRNRFGLATAWLAGGMHKRAGALSKE
jgi:DNA-binding MltR family transcriptional regulator